MTFDELAGALKDLFIESGSKIDVLGLDACYMCMGELAHEIREYAEILIGAEGLEPAFGWPYRRILATAKRNGGPLGCEDLARAIVTEYVEHYSDYDRAAGRSADLSALRLGAQMEAVTAAFASLVAALRGTPAGHDKVLLAHWYAQTYKADQFVDLDGPVRPSRDGVSGRTDRH